MRDRQHRRCARGFGPGMMARNRCARRRMQTCDSKDGYPAAASSPSSTLVQFLPARASTKSYSTSQNGPSNPSSADCLGLSIMLNAASRLCLTPKTVPESRICASQCARSECANKIQQNQSVKVGGPGGCTKNIDFIGLFVGRNHKLSRIVPYGSANLCSRTRVSQ